MPNGSRGSEFARRLGFAGGQRDVRFTARVVVGTLLALDVAAALFVFKPWGGSAEDLREQQARLEQEVMRRQSSLERSKQMVAKIEKGRQAGDRFMDQYLLNRRTAYSTIVGELDRITGEAGVKPKETQFAVEAIEGSNEALGIMAITANFEGAYGNLTKLIHLIDRSPKFLIIESVQAQPQINSANINLNMKLNCFVRGAAGEIQ